MNINNALDDLVHRLHTLPISAFKDVDRRRLRQTTNALIALDAALTKLDHPADSQEETR